MSKCISSIKAIATRLVFATHGLIAIWQVTLFKKHTYFWYLGIPIILLFFEGVFTLTVKTNQEWKWFCPSVFLYLSSVVPAIWLLELDKVERQLKTREEFNLTASAASNLKELQNLIGVQIKLPTLNLSTDTWITLIEQFLMLTLIIGRWMLPKGDLSRDQLSQILLVYIGTAADIIEFFDSFKDDKVASQLILVLLTLGIWSWSLLQFTVVLTATKSRKSRMSTATSGSRRLHVVYSESRKKREKKNVELTSIAVISKSDIGNSSNKRRRQRKKKHRSQQLSNMKDTGYSTASSHGTAHHCLNKAQKVCHQLGKHQQRKATFSDEVSSSDSASWPCQRHTEMSD